LRGTGLASQVSHDYVCVQEYQWPDSFRDGLFGLRHLFHYFIVCEATQSPAIVGRNLARYT
jgi:hypothetical protein